MKMNIILYLTPFHFLVPLLPAPVPVVVVDVPLDEYMVLDIKPSNQLYFPG